MKDWKAEFAQAGGVVTICPPAKHVPTFRYPYDQRLDLKRVDENPFLDLDELEEEFRWLA